MGLDKKLTNRIKDTRDLSNHLEKKYTDCYVKALRNFFNWMEYQELEHFNDIPIEKWRNRIKIKRCGVREIYISNDELKEAYRNIDNDNCKILLKLLVFSGMRLSQTLRGIENMKNIVVKDKLVRIPISSTSKGNKKGYWLYFPSKFLEELKEFDNGYTYDTYEKKLKHKRVMASTIRKWNHNFLIENEIPESIADFLQGRSSTTVGSSHYLNKIKQSDREYNKIVEKLSSFFH